MPISCWSCSYEWEPRVPKPKECPRCKARLDRPRPEREEGRWSANTAPRSHTTAPNTGAALMAGTSSAIKAMAGSRTPTTIAPSAETNARQTKRK